MTTDTSPPFVSATELRALMAQGPGPLVLDASFELADPAAGETSYGQGHLPGSHYVHLDRDLCATTTGTNGRHPLPERSAFAKTAGLLGVTPASLVIALDRQGGMYAARLWWMLRWLGHGRVAVLDGGFAAWVSAGGTVSADPVNATPASPYPDLPPLVGSVDAAGLGRRIGQATILDARSPERFRGEKEPIDPVAGHIPGALNRFHAANLAPDGRFKSAEQLAREFGAALGGRDPREIVHSCGSGVTACHNLLAMERAGLSGSLLYPGSWSEWSSDPGRPIARG